MRVAYGVAQGFAGVKVAVAALAILIPMLLIVGVGFAVAGDGGSSSGGVACKVVGKNGKEIPANYVPLLERAAVKYKLGEEGFSIVAAIHSIESDFGRSPLPGVARGTENSVGAMGPGQFLGPSWETFGQDGDGDGVKDVYSIPDSVFGTAYYMQQSGAPRDWRSAIFAYNHANWYVEDVLERAKEFGRKLVCTGGTGGALGAVAMGDVAGMEEVARWIEAKRIHYCWGGGHAPKPGPSTGSGEFCPPGTKGLDCSGSVRWLLVLSGYPDPGGLRSDFLGAKYQPGPGKAVTIWSNATHIWIEINGKDWGTGSANPFHGPAFGSQATAGFTPTHPAGL